MCLFVTISSAQSVQDVNGRVYKAKSLSEVSGNTLLFQEFLKGDVKFKDGKDIKGLQLNFDALDNILLFKNSSTVIQEVSEPIKSFIIYETKNGKDSLKTFESGFGKVLNFDEKTFYEVLYNGKYKFLKKINKYIIETSGYNAGTKSEEIREKLFYFIEIEGKLTQVSKNQKSIIGLFPEKESLIKDFIKKNKLNLSNEEDIVILLSKIESL